MPRIVPPEPGEPRRPHGPRNAGDAWVEGDKGRFWGRFGAAGLLAWDRDRGILLQHRAIWSDRGGTWGLPGGALHEGEDAIDGALREAHEEAAVPASALSARFTSVFSVGYWSYTTVVADVTQPFDPEINDPESIALEWVPVEKVDELPLHPGFAAAWPMLRAQLGRRPQLVVDAANVVGARPDGWWKDRAAAAERLRDGLQALAHAGLDAAELELPGERWRPEVTLIIEGKARGIADVDGVRVVNAPHEGDDEIVEQVSVLVAEHPNDVTTITSDRELASRVTSRGGRVHGAAWLWDRIDRAASR